MVGTNLFQYYGSNRFQLNAHFFVSMVFIVQVVKYKPMIKYKLRVVSMHRVEPLVM